MTEGDRQGSWDAAPADPPQPSTEQPPAGYDNTTGSDATQVVRVDEIDAADLPVAPSAGSAEPPAADAPATDEPGGWTPPAEQPSGWTPPAEPEEWTPPPAAEQVPDPDRTAIYQVQEPAPEHHPADDAGSVDGGSAAAAAAGAATASEPPAAYEPTTTYEPPAPAESSAPSDGPAPSDSPAAPVTGDAPVTPVGMAAPSQPEPASGPPAPGWAPYAGAAAGGYAAGYQQGDPNAPRPGEIPAYAPPSGPTQTGYGYNDPGYPGAPAPQQTAVMAPARPARVVLPKGPSRVGANLLAALAGLVLAFGGLALLVMALPAMNLNATANKIVGIICVVIIVVPALLLAWGPLAALIPGLLFTGLSLWLLLFDDAPRQLVQAMGQPFDGSPNWGVRLVAFFASPTGLGLGLALLFAGIAAIMVRSFTRRSIQDALDAEHAAAEMQPVLRQP